jgi:hypothetical protein
VHNENSSGVPNVSELSTSFENLNLSSPTGASNVAGSSNSVCPSGIPNASVVPNAYANPSTSSNVPNVSRPVVPNTAPRESTNFPNASSNSYVSNSDDGHNIVFYNHLSAVNLSLLPTVQILVQDFFGNFINVRALLDSGAR